MMSVKSKRTWKVHTWWTCGYELARRCLGWCPGGFSKEGVRQAETALHLIWVHRAAYHTDCQDGPSITASQAGIPTNLLIPHAGDHCAQQPPCGNARNRVAGSGGVLVVCRDPPVQPGHRLQQAQHSIFLFGRLGDKGMRWSQLGFDGAQQVQTGMLLTRMPKMSIWLQPLGSTHGHALTSIYQLAHFIRVSWWLVHKSLMSVVDFACNYSTLIVHVASSSCAKGSRSFTWLYLENSQDGIAVTDACILHMHSSQHLLAVYLCTTGGAALGRLSGAGPGAEPGAGPGAV